MGPQATDDRPHLPFKGPYYREPELNNAKNVFICCKGAIFIVKALADFHHRFYNERMNTLISVQKPHEPL